jgi:hypothetical protein
LYGNGYDIIMGMDVVYYIVVLFLVLWKRMGQGMHLYSILGI